MARRNKHILNQAKEQRESELSEALDKATAAYEAVYQSETRTPEAFSEANEKLDAARVAMEEWRSLGKRNRKKLGRQVNWTASRSSDSRPGLRIDKDALAEARATRKANTKSQVGINWLYEGALVTRRGTAGVMIVTQIKGNTVECLNGTFTRWYRNVALRPAEWQMED